MKCLMCGKPLKKFTHVWREKLNNPKLRPVSGKYIPGQGIVTEVIRYRGEPGNLQVTYWTYQMGYRGKGMFCSLKCSYKCTKIENSSAS